MTDERRMEIIRETTIVARAIRRKERELQEEGRPVAAIEMLEIRHGIIRTAEALVCVPSGQNF